MKITNISKCFGERQVLMGISLDIEAGKRYALMGQSGCGKTTLLRIIMGLEKPDSGTVSKYGGKLAAVFQEDRLCEDFDAVKNVYLTQDTGVFSKEDTIRHLMQVGLDRDSDCNKPVRKLSGGMRRRVAVVRAVLSGADFIVMDEPFSGMDDETCRKVISYICEYTKDKTLLVVTHQREDAIQLGAQIISLTNNGCILEESNVGV